MSFKARDALARIEPYVPGKSIEELKALKGIGDAVKLASNENPLGAGTRVQAAISEAAEQAHVYPDGGAQVLKERLSRHLGVAPENLIMGCGSDEIIRMLAEAYLDPGTPAVFADVTFSQYAYATRLMDGEEVTVPLTDGRHDLGGLALAAGRRRARLCFVCNPNNPTGTYVGESDVLAFLDSVPDETLVVFDEAYFEYVAAHDFPDLIPLVKDDRRIALLRTFSKAYGLAGLRIGYGIAPAGIVAELERVRAPFNVNRIAQAAALAALDDREHLEESRRMNASERRRLFRAFQELGLNPLPSQTNFVFVELGVPSSAVYEALLDRGVVVREGAPFGCPNGLRITVGTPKQNDRLLEALAGIMASVATKGEV